MPSHSFANFKIQNYYQNKPKSNDVYCRDNKCKIKDGTYIIHSDEYESLDSFVCQL